MWLCREQCRRHKISIVGTRIKLSLHTAGLFYMQKHSWSEIHSGPTHTINNDPQNKIMHFSVDDKLHYRVI